MKQTRIRRRPIADINVVPYIDVMLVLLVIFMITTPLLTQGVTIKLPQAKAQTLSVQQQMPLIITVDAKGQYFLNVANKPNKPISAHALATRVAAELALAKQANQKRSVLVKGDQQVDYGSVVRAMVLLQTAGAQSVGLITKQPDEKA